jgi:hypothetical protein
MFGKEDTPQVVLDINKLIEQVLVLIARKMEEKGVKLRVEYAEPCLLVRANRVQLQQVLLNLSMNAIEAMSTVYGRDRILKLRTEIDRTGHALIVVQDSGPGSFCHGWNSFSQVMPGISVRACLLWLCSPRLRRLVAADVVTFGAAILRRHRHPSSKCSHAWIGGPARQSDALPVLLACQ